MKKVTLDTAKNVIGGACSSNFDLKNDVCVQTISCTEATKYGTATNITSKNVASSYCGVTPEPEV